MWIWLSKAPATQQLEKLFGVAPPHRGIETDLLHTESVYVPLNFLPELKHLHDADYNILTYDLRNHRQSGEANGVDKQLGVDRTDDIPTLEKPVSKTQKNLGSMTTGLHSRHMGSNSSWIG